MAVRLGSLRGPHGLVVYLLGLVAIFVGERLVGGEGLARLMVSGLGLLGVLAVTGLFLWAWLNSVDEARRVERLASLLALLGLLALGLYALTTELVAGPAPLARVGEQGLTGRQLLSAAWPIVLAAAVLPLCFLQWSLASMGQGRGIEWSRARASTGAGAVLAVFLCTLFLLNVVADRLDVNADLSYFRTSSPSEASRAMVRGLEADVEALLFFPRANDVGAEVRGYFDALARGAARFRVRPIELAMEPELAKAHRVTKEGTVVLVRGGTEQRIEIGDKLDTAKRKLRKLDGEFQTAMLNLAYKREVVYLLTGHGERTAERVEGDGRQLLSMLKKVLEARNFTVKRLGAIQGLAEDVPEDAAFVLWAGPTDPLFPGELEALKRYLDRGGRLLMLVDPEAESRPAAELMAHLNLELEPGLLAHARYFVPYARAEIDRYNLVTDKFSNHAASSTVSRYSRDLPVAVPTAGALRVLRGGEAELRTTFILRSLPETWQDRNGDLQRQPDEPSRVFDLAAAVSRKLPARPEEKKAEPPRAEPSAAAPATDEKTEEKKTEEKKVAVTPSGHGDSLRFTDEMRALVYADADLFADLFLGFQGNPNLAAGGNLYLLMDGLQWLVGEERLGGVAESEEDLPVAHTRSQDVLWFYGTVFAVPVLILVLGVATRWGRGRRRARS
jgi:hypothetical protein